MKVQEIKVRKFTSWRKLSWILEIYQKPEHEQITKQIHYEHEKQQNLQASYKSSIRGNKETKKNIRCNVRKQKKGVNNARYLQLSKVTQLSKYNTHAKERRSSKIITHIVKSHSCTQKKTLSKKNNINSWAQKVKSSKSQHQWGEKEKIHMKRNKTCKQFKLQTIYKASTNGNKETTMNMNF